MGYHNKKATASHWQTINQLLSQEAPLYRGIARWQRWINVLFLQLTTSKEHHNILHCHCQILSKRASILVLFFGRRYHSEQQPGQTSQTGEQHTWETDRQAVQLTSTKFPEYTSSSVTSRSTIMSLPRGMFLSCWRGLPPNMNPKSPKKLE